MPPLEPSRALASGLVWLGAGRKCLATVRQTFEGSDVIETKAQWRTVLDQPSFLELDEYAGQSLDAQRQSHATTPHFSELVMMFGILPSWLLPRERATKKAATRSIGFL